MVIPSPLYRHQIYRSMTLCASIRRFCSTSFTNDANRITSDSIGGSSRTPREGDTSSINRIYKRIVIHWFRITDLRLSDNQALYRSSQLAVGNNHDYGQCKVIPIFIFDEAIYGNKNITKKYYGLLKCPIKRAQFILESVIDLRQQLYDIYESHLLIAYGNPVDIFEDLLSKLNDPKNHNIPDGNINNDGDDAENNTNNNITEFYMDTNIVVQDEPAREERSVVRAVQRVLNKYNTETRHSIFNKFTEEFDTNKDLYEKTRRMHKVWGSTLYMPRNMPWDKSFNNISNYADGFTNRMVRMHKIENLLPVPKYLAFPTEYLPFLYDWINYMPTLLDLGYTQEQIENEINTIDPRSQIKDIKGGETAGLQRIQNYIWDTDTLHSWNKMKSKPLVQNNTTKFSLYLAHGCISPRTIAVESEKYFKTKKRDNGNTLSKVDLVKRDHCKYYARKHSNALFRPYIGPVVKKKGTYRDLKPTIKPKRFHIWKDGKTGYPLVDASMRELNATGYINDRCRLILASFLCHDLHFEWTHGAYYFESKCVDYNVFCNWVNWAVVAGNTSGHKYDKLYYNHEYKYYDPNGEYIRKWVEELQDLPNELITEPWKIKETEEVQYNFRYGIDYPYRVVLPKIKSIPNRNSSDVQVIEEMIKRNISLKGIKGVAKTLQDYYNNNNLPLPPGLAAALSYHAGNRSTSSGTTTITGTMIHHHEEPKTIITDES